MTTTRQGASRQQPAPESTVAGEDRAGTNTHARVAAGGWQPGSYVSDTGGGGGARRKRRRQRSQRANRRRPPGQGHADGVSRERIFQELEGLLRQIREEAEESSTWAEADISAMAQAVSTFTKELEGQSEPISERLRSEYQRIREKLSQALRGER